MIYTGAFDIYTQENLKLLGISILMVVVSYIIAYQIVSRFSKSEAQYMIITITKLPNQEPNKDPDQSIKQS
jgi:hypothetical protein